MDVLSPRRAAVVLRLINDTCDVTIEAGCFRRNGASERRLVRPSDVDRGSSRRRTRRTPYAAFRRRSSVAAPSLLFVANASSHSVKSRLLKTVDVRSYRRSPFP